MHILCFLCYCSSHLLPNKKHINCWSSRLSLFHYPLPPQLLLSLRRLTLAHLSCLVSPPLSSFTSFAFFPCVHFAYMFCLFMLCFAQINGTHHVLKCIFDESVSPFEMTLNRQSISCERVSVCLCVAVNSVACSLHIILSRRVHNTSRCPL